MIYDSSLFCGHATEWFIIDQYSTGMYMYILSIQKYIYAKKVNVHHYPKKMKSFFEISVD